MLSEQNNSAIQDLNNLKIGNWSDLCTFNGTKDCLKKSETSPRDCISSREGADNPFGADVPDLQNNSNGANKPAGDSKNSLKPPKKKSKSDAKARMRRWRANNSEKNRLNDLRCRVYRDAKIKFGASRGKYISEWVEKEIQSRLYKRYMREKKLLGDNLDKNLVSKERNKKPCHSKIEKNPKTQKDERNENALRGITRVDRSSHNFPFYSTRTSIETNQHNHFHYNSGTSRNITMPSNLNNLQLYENTPLYRQSNTYTQYGAGIKKNSISFDGVQYQPLIYPTANQIKPSSSIPSWIFGNQPKVKYDIPGEIVQGENCLSIEGCLNKGI
ncbi:hypothetical protein BB560_003336 [Smittium megazygosporum]|uniref:DUF3020 domain-containing protein n=1 Tax=Smittium megazygosporum TaxID=133381 RepID=A0A2T9ZCD9_9FUNG|nr:hypothetical protein BB560_003336 [Smittium megazygosporum]